MDEQLNEENDGSPETSLGDQSVSPIALLFSEHELLPPKLPKVILKRSIPVDDGAESSTILPYHMKLRRESKQKKSKHILSSYDVELDEYKNAYTNKIIEFPIRTLEWLPQQNNGYDCGMHVIKYFELIQFIDSEGCLIQFDSWDARQRLALGLVRDANNKIGSRVIELACDR
ncbi:hypothetical protein CsSME_00048241 [Camellia sinensis var. sinensis]